ncbi:hypothetical protein ACH5RR_014247 [Cinchona calisaya]|uniref:TPX2 C-terminal domain-containing protein n=1 Tax=Cinchona calisaya TaxID=153742 RepID=A0ABD3A2B6_9GENT
MDSKVKTARAVTTTTPVKERKSNRSKIDEMSTKSENFNPNFSPVSKLSNSPAIKSARKTQKSASEKCKPDPNPMVSPPNKNKIRERKFVVAKKNSKREKVNSSAAVVCKCDNKANKCFCVAYGILRASQEEFFKNGGSALEKTERAEEGEKDDGCADQVFDDFPERCRLEDENGGSCELGVSGSIIKRRRDKLLEDGRQSVPESGSGRVLHLVKAFEKLLSIPKSTDSEEKVEEEEEKEIEDTRKGMKWALPCLQPPMLPETQVSSSSFCPSDFILTSESLGLDSHVSSSLDSSQGRNSGGGRRNSAESSGTFARRHWKRKQLKQTSQKPFKLRTEQRGSCKQEEFFKKVKQMMEEEEKQRIPIAQGLPWTTDDPECLVKPPVKETTRPLDLVLHSDIRAVERAEFEYQVAEKLSLAEQYKLERERQQKLAEEEELRRLRKELIPKAQPMPYFDRPFIPRRSMKLPTIPRDPKFHIPQQKKIKSCMSWNDIYTDLYSEGGL